MITNAMDVAVLNEQINKLTRELMELSAQYRMLEERLETEKIKNETIGEWISERDETISQLKFALSNRTSFDILADYKGRLKNKISKIIDAV